MCSKTHALVAMDMFFLGSSYIGIDPADLCLCCFFALSQDVPKLLIKLFSNHILKCYMWVLVYV